MAASTVRQIHSIISAALTAAERWGWIAANLGRVAHRPRAKAPEPDPPSPADAARLVDAAFALDDDWGTLVWLAMTTGMRRGELCALRWKDVDLDAETVEIRRSYVLHRGVGVEKDTKTHQMRRIALDSETLALLRGHRDRVRARTAEVNAELTGQAVVFASVRCPDHGEPYSPHAVSSRYKEMPAARHSDAPAFAAPLLSDRVADRGCRSPDGRRSARSRRRRRDHAARVRGVGGGIG
jgi:integrase